MSVKHLLIYHAFFLSARTGLFGGVGGFSFDDVQGTQTQEIVGIRALRIRHNVYIESIRAEYILADGNVMVPNAHGGTAEREIRIPFTTGATITEIRGITDGRFLLDMTFFTRIWTTQCWFARTYDIFQHTYRNGSTNLMQN